MSHSNKERTPDQLISIFSESRFTFGIVVAVVLHLVFFLATSVGYLRDHLIDPEGAAARAQAAAHAAEKPAPAASPAAAPAKPEAAPAAQTAQTAQTSEAPAHEAAAATGVTASASASPAEASKSNQELMKERADSPVIQKITDTASPNEIPKEPGDEGLSLDVTHPAQ